MQSLTVNQDLTLQVHTRLANYQKVDQGEFGKFFNFFDTFFANAYPKIWKRQGNAETHLMVAGFITTQQYNLTVSEHAYVNAVLNALDCCFGHVSKTRIPNHLKLLIEKEVIKEYIRGDKRPVNVINEDYSKIMFLCNPAVEKTIQDLDEANSFS